MANVAELLGSPTERWTEYLSELVSQPLQSILAEPTTLQTQSHHLTSSLTTLTHSSYPSLLAVNESSAALNESIQDLSNSLELLVNESLPSLQSLASEWPSRTDTILRDRARARSVLELHDKIRDLLDIPLLIQTCVRNGFYAEALSLQSHATALGNMPDAPPLLLSVLADVHTAVNQMLLSLLTTLHEPNGKLPTLWKTVNFLRKMIHVDDTEELLALLFLSGREASLAGALQVRARDREELAKYLKKHIDVWREGVHDIITQFNSIFLERNEKRHIAHSLLTHYTSHALSSHLIPTLTTVLPHLPTYLPSFLTQLTYCATAFARVGLNFQGLLPGIFSSAVLFTFQSQCRSGVDAFHKRLTRATERKQPLLPSTWLAEIDAKPATLDTKTGPHVPPASLASYPPIAELLNAFLEVMNALRLLAPVDLVGSLIRELDTALGDAGAALVQYFQAPAIERQAEEVVLARRVGRAYFDVLVVHVRRALQEGVYGLETTTQAETDTLLQAIQQWEGWLEKTGSESVSES
ncbi:Dor1-like family-domain-containing protein [Pterulicium gracile]|uniref:Conserved oligomeric Golgi complex subunit 8 n=1 Tax=Pterulicium gracile TaxID=1884261 RepID=A0A5C3QWH6_9AGAR|nr:Dor1-like family-domain-containing protein [Pterula gracilis]